MRVDLRAPASLCCVSPLYVRAMRVYARGSPKTERSRENHSPSPSQRRKQRRSLDRGY